MVHTAVRLVGHAERVVVMAEITDMELSERVCRALGIEPLGYASPIIEGSVRVDKTPVPYYPSVLDGAGFLRAEQALAERYPGSLLDLTRDPHYGYSCRLIIDGVPYSRCFADTLPKAFALAVEAWGASRG